MNENAVLSSRPMDKRRAGVLAHISSLPGPLGSGDLSHDAYRFVEFCAASGFSVWQVLPLNPTQSDGSPYYSYSANAGNPLLISLDWLVDRGWLPASMLRCAHSDFQRHRFDALQQAHAAFAASADARWRERYAAFCHQASGWLEDYAAFMAIHAQQSLENWTQWPEALRHRRGAAYEQALQGLSTEREQIRFQQFLFFEQWSDLRAYAHRHGVLLFGDLPIFVAHHSADVWAQPQLWQLDDAGEPMVVAGVPPDYFSDTGQIWGNPLYRWDAHRDQHFAWWLQRLITQRDLFDLLRIDHFRGLQACWEIQAGAETAIGGRWVKTPGDELLSRIQHQLPELPLVAEDLGEITEEVHALRKRFALPGMRVLQFAFGAGPDNLHLPHNYDTDLVAYTGTHDNAVTREWYESLGGDLQAEVQRYLPQAETMMPDALIEAVYASVARLAVIPMQDVLQLGAGHRMNTPGTISDRNWRWRFDWSQLTEARRTQLSELAARYNRV